MRAKNSIKIKQKQKLKHVLPVLHFKLSHWVERTSLGMKQAQNGYLNNTEKKKKKQQQQSNQGKIYDGHSDPLQTALTIKPYWKLSRSMDRVVLADQDRNFSTLHIWTICRLPLSQAIRSGATLARFALGFDSFSVLGLCICTLPYSYFCPNAFHKLSSWMPSFEISTGLTLSTHFRSFGSRSRAFKCLRLYLYSYGFATHFSHRVYQTADMTIMRSFTS